MNNISKQPKYTIRKLSVGVASCFIGFTFLGIDSTLIQADDAIVALEAGQRSIDEIREEALKKINELDNAPREKFKTNYPYNTTADDPFAADIGGMDNFIKSAQTEDDISSALKAAESLVLERKLEIVHSDAKNFSEKINSKNIITPEANKQFSEAYAKLCESSKHLKDSYQNVKSLNALFNTDKSKFLTQYNKIVEENTEILNKNLNARIDFEEKEGDIYLKQIDTITNNAKSSIRLAMPYSNKSNVKELVDKINEKLNLPVANINDYFEIYNNIQKLDDFVNEEKIKEKIQKNVVEYANKVIDQSELHKENNAVAAEQKKLKKMLDNQVKDYENIKSQSVKLAKVIEYNIDLRKEKDAAKSKLKDADIATKHFISVIDNTQSIDSLKELVDQLYEPKLNESKEKALKRLEKANITGQYFKDLINNAKTIPAVNALTEEIYITKLNEVKEKAIKALADADVTRKYFTDLINNSNSIPAIKSLTNSIIESKNSQKGMTPPEKDGENSDKPGTPPEKDGENSDKPGTIPEKDGENSDKPGTPPEKDGENSDKPGTPPEKDGENSDKPGTIPEKDGENSDKPGTPPREDKNSDSSRSMNNKNIQRTPESKNKNEEAPSMPLPKSGKELKQNKESKQNNKTSLPQTGEISLFGTAAMSMILGLGLTISGFKRKEH